VFSINNLVGISGVIALILAAFMYRATRRFEEKNEKARFERRNSSGVEEFESYEHMKRTRKTEALRDTGALFLAFPGVALMIGGILAICYAWLPLLTTR